MKIEILDLAKADLLDGYRFYEECESGLGNYFLSNLFTDIESLGVHAGFHPRPYRNFYRALSKRFPFAIFYTIESDIVKVRSILNCRRRPSWIRKHLNS